MRMTGMLLSASFLAEDVNAGKAGELEIGENHKKAARANLGDGAIPVSGFLHGVAHALEGFAEHGAELGLVFDKKNRFHRFTFNTESQAQDEREAGCIARGRWRRKPAAANQRY